VQEDDAAQATIELASQLLMTGWRPAAALHLEEQAENALIEVDYSLVHFGQGFGI